MIRRAIGRWTLGQVTRLMGLYVPWRQAKLRSIPWFGWLLADCYLVALALGARWGRLD